MAANEYLLGLLAIITGLAIVDLLASLHNLFIAKARVKWDWLALMAAVLIGLTLIISWWVSWQRFGQAPEISWPLWRFVLTLAQVSALYMAVRASLPDAVPEEGVDLADYYAHHGGYMWRGMLATNLLVVSALFLSGWEPLTNDPGLWLAQRWPYFVTTGVFLALILFKRRRVHAVLVPLLLAWVAYSTLGDRLTG